MTNDYLTKRLAISEKRPAAQDADLPFGSIADWDEASGIYCTLTSGIHGPNAQAETLEELEINILRAGAGLWEAQRKGF
ncbi:MAG: hypothetical protein AAGH45_05085 [Pseudomonadota bacterium]